MVVRWKIVAHSRITRAQRVLAELGLLVEVGNLFEPLDSIAALMAVGPLDLEQFLVYAGCDLGICSKTSTGLPYPCLIDGKLIFPELFGP